jgi:hypothetical protein
VLYLTTPSTPDAKDVLQRALDAFLVVTGDNQAPQVLYQLQYEQLVGSETIRTEGSIITLPAPSLSLSLEDSILEPVHEAWEKAMGNAAVEAEYMAFPDREGAMDDDEFYE